MDTSDENRNGTYKPYLNRIPKLYVYPYGNEWRNLERMGILNQIIPTLSSERYSAVHPLHCLNSRRKLYDRYIEWKESQKKKTTWLFKMNCFFPQYLSWE